MRSITFQIVLQQVKDLYIRVRAQDFKQARTFSSKLVKKTRFQTKVVLSTTNLLKKVRTPRNLVLESKSLKFLDPSTRFQGARPFFS